RRRIQRRFTHRRKLRISSSQTGSSFAPELSVRFAPALSAPISRPGVSFLRRALRTICDCRSCAQTCSCARLLKRKDYLTGCAIRFNRIEEFGRRKIIGQNRRVLSWLGKSKAKRSACRDRIDISAKHIVKGLMQSILEHVFER